MRPVTDLPSAGLAPTETPTADLSPAEVGAVLALQRAIGAGWDPRAGAAPWATAGAASRGATPVAPRRPRVRGSPSAFRL